jgi:phosphate transport system substrate-binding protein
MIHRIAALAALVFMPGAGWTAGPVTLTTLDGSRTITGDLISFDGEFFRVETEFGPVTLDSGDVTCEGAVCPEPDAVIARVSVGGPEDMVHRLMSPLLESFARREGLGYRRIFTADTAVTWELSDPGSGRLLAEINGDVSSDDVAVARLVSRDAVMSMGRREGGGGLNRDVIALDAMVPVVSLDNPLAMVTLDDFRGLLTGSLTNWSALDGPDLPVRLYLPEKSAAEASLDRVFPGIRLAPAEFNTDPKAQAADVSRDPGALGLIPLSMIGNTVPLVIGGACGLATPATRASVKAEDYPLTQPLFMHRIGARQPRIIRDFIAYARSHESQPVIRAAGFIDQGIGLIPFDRQGYRLANAVLSAGDDAGRLQEVQRMIESLMEGERLTLTFRFRDGSSELDPQSASNIRRLSDAIQRGDFDGRTLSFVGFTDGEGPADGNLRLSERRARAVRQAVAVFVRDAPVTLSTEGFGEIMPMACDDTAWGRQVNRRVEVWLRRSQDQPLR